MRLRIMTYNIRYAATKDGINDWANRKQLVVDMFRKHAPDIIACQEVLPEQLDVLQAAMPSYHVIAVSREGWATNAEMVPLFIQNFHLESSGVFWLSDTPDVPGSNTWGSLPRICTWAILQDEAGKQFGVFNTHLDHGRSDDIRLKSVPLLLDHIKTLCPGEPAILLGDFNCFPRSEPYHLLSEQLIDAGSAAKPPLPPAAITFHDYTGKVARSRFHPYVQQIDYIWLKNGDTGGFKVDDFRIVHDHPESMPGVYPSDHWPVMADLEVV